MKKIVWSEETREMIVKWARQSKTSTRLDFLFWKGCVQYNKMQTEVIIPQIKRSELRHIALGDIRGQSDWDESKTKNGRFRLKLSSI
jgi:hypothetical protein